jgi:hypothetical protein
MQHGSKGKDWYDMKDIEEERFRQFKCDSPSSIDLSTVYRFYLSGILTDP